MKTKLLGFFLLFFAFSCGPSQVEIKAREKFIIDSIQRVQFTSDSIAKVIEDNAALEAKKQEQEKNHQENLKVGQQIKKEKLKEYIAQLEEQLRKEKKKHLQISEFKLLRSSTEKKNELNKQQEKISEIEVVIAALDNELAMVNNLESFDFQNSPEGTLNYIFIAAKTGDYVKLRYLVDPYGKFDNDVFGLCLTGSMPKQVKEQFVSDFSEGRVVGSPIYNDSIAEVEFAFGVGSNQLEQMHLVNRMGKWYLQRF